MIFKTETARVDELSSFNLRTFYHPEFLLVMFVGAVYVLLHNVFRTANVDDAWSLSFAYNYLFKHISSDITFGSSTGGCGVMYFGKTYAFLYGAILDGFGWTKSNAIYISTLLIGLSAVIWYFIILRLTRLRKFAFLFATLMVIVEPLFQAANEARPDALTFLLVSVSFLAMIYDKPIGAGLAAMVAFESHPMGIAAFFYIFSAVFVGLKQYGFDKKAFVRQTIRLMTGVGLGLIYFLALHYQFLGTLAHSVASSNRSHRIFSNLFTDYFFYTDFARHLLELLFVLVSLAYFIKRKYYRNNLYILTLLIVLPGILLFVKRPSFRYIIYIYPVFLWLILETFRRLNRLKLAVILWLILLLPPYTLFYIRHHDYNLNAYLTKIAAAVPRDQIPVVGGSNDWFAFKDRRFYAVNYNGKLKRKKLAEFYLIENTHYRHHEFPQLESLIKYRYTGKKLAVFNVNHEYYQVILERANR